MNLFGKEMKRILRTKSTLIFLAAALFFSIFMAYIPVTYETWTYEDENGQEVTIKGREALKVIKEGKAPAAGTVTAGKMTAGLAAYQRNLELYGDFYGNFPKNVYNTEIRPYSALVQRLHEVMADPITGLAPDYMDITQEDAASFYERCDSRLEALMKIEQKNNPEAQRKASAMYEKVEKPFVYYPGYGSNMMEYLEMYLFILVFVCALVTAPLFSAEYQTGALSLFATVSFTLFLSAAGKNTTMTMGLAIGFCLAPALLYFMVGGTYGSWLRALLPSGGVGLTNAFLYAVIDFEFLKAGPFTIWTPWLLLLVPCILIPIFLVLTVRSYCRRSL